MKLPKLSYRVLLLTFLGLSALPASANQSLNCANAMLELTSLEKVDAALAKKLESALEKHPALFTKTVVAAYLAWKTHFQSEPWKTLFPKNLVLGILGDFEGSIRADELGKALLSISKSKAFSKAKDTSSAKKLSQDVLKRRLTNNVPKNQISDRLQSFWDKPTLSSFRRALGEKTRDEVQLLLHGGNINKPSPDSLLGQYLKESGATPIRRGFPSGSGERSPKGKPKTVVSAKITEKLFQKYFSHPEFLFHVHQPSQGTLLFLHDGRTGTYAKYTASKLRTSQIREGTLLPMIILSSKEAERARLYFSLGILRPNGQTIAQYPWSLKDYCATGGYTSCTHWFGEMPLGEDLVKEYRFPGNADRYAGNAPSSSPQQKELSPYSFNRPDPKSINLNDFGKRSPLGAISDDKALVSEMLVRSVWKAPGNMQMWQMLNVRDSLDEGELANPGWVLRVLTGKTKADRVPLVFRFGDSHKKLNSNFSTEVRAY